MDRVVGAIFAIFTMVLVGGWESEATPMPHTPQKSTPMAQTFQVTSGYGYRSDPFTGRKRMHKGIDLAAPKGTPVKARASGVVTYAGRRGSYGKIVEIDHGTHRTRYAHLSRIKVRSGQSVTPDQIIGLVGSTGRSTGPHLHLEVLVDGKQTNPKKFLNI